jgi:hypothetical protein
MTGIMGKWPSGHGQPTKIRLPDSCRGKTNTMAAQFDYDRHGFEGYPGNVGSVHLVERINQDVWSYYGVFMVKSGPVDGHEKSFINRSAAFYRFLIDESAGQIPPLAP